jgi:hypothetical protein
MEQPDSAAIEPLTETFDFKLGENKITLKKRTYDTVQSYVVVQLHHNEATAEQAAALFLEQHGGTLLSLENNGDRYISFRLNGSMYTFDPNRMFTPSGIASSLRLLSTYTVEAAQEVENFASFIQDHLPDSALLIAVHNNTDDKFSIRSYQIDTAFKGDAAAVHINEALDADNFFFTTDHGLFKQLQARQQNVVLQHNQQAKDDGSLSIYYGRQNKPYINVEAQNGHLEEQLQMLMLLKSETF